jgi:hypothetical protein
VIPFPAVVDIRSRIETKITSGGSEIAKGEWVQVRDRFTPGPTN